MSAATESADPRFLASPAVAPRFAWARLALRPYRRSSGPRRCRGPRGGGFDRHRDRAAADA